MYATGFDSLYREPKDGMISLLKTKPSTIELVTLIDLSTLWEAKQLAAVHYAKKICTLKHRNLLNITREMRVLDNHIPGGFVQFTTEAPDHISSWKCFCKRPMSLHETLSVFRGLLLAQIEIHDSGLIFRDFHPTRIHLYNGITKFNLVGMPYNFKKLLKNESFSGHLNYSPPEILEHGSEKNLTQKVDVWSLGCCLYYLVAKRDPFDGQSPIEIKSNIRTGKLDKGPLVDKDDQGQPRHPIIQNLLKACLTVDFDKRPSSKELLDLLDKLIYENRKLFTEIYGPIKQADDPEV